MAQLHNVDFIIRDKFKKVLFNLHLNKTFLAGFYLIHYKIKYRLYTAESKIVLIRS